MTKQHRMRLHVIAFVAAVSVSAGAAHVSAQGTDPGSSKSAKNADSATLRVVFRYAGELPKRRMIPIDPPLDGFDQYLDERLLVDPATRGIQNVAVYHYDRSSAALAGPTAEPKTRRIEIRDARFLPRVSVACAGDTLEVVNRDEFGYSTNISFFKNPASCRVFDHREVFELEFAEPAPVPIACNVHPWMRGHVVIVDHPYAAVSDAQGVAEIRGLPAGETLQFRAFHESIDFQEVVVNGRRTKWDRRKFQVPLRSGINELIVKIDD